MLRSRWQRGARFAAPGLLLAGFGAVHPGQFDTATASWWAALHVILLLVFPVLAVAQWSLLTPASPWLRWPGRLAAFGFAAFCGGLDAVARDRRGHGGARPTRGHAGHRCGVRGW